MFRESVEFGPTLDAAAERLGISATAVEKDYWVSQVLRVLSAGFSDDFVFKGGTSLSKAFGIVERFSEDVDLLVLAGARGRGGVDKLMKSMADAAAAGLGGEKSPVGASETGRHRSYEIKYPATREATSLIATSVLLEMGIRGGPHPSQSASIGSLLGDALNEEGVETADYDDLAPFDVLVLHPARTLLEKLAHIHQLALEPEPRRRNGRHFYDIHQLLGHPDVMTLLQDREQTRQVIESIDEVTRSHWGGTESQSVRPGGGFASSPAFDPSSPVAAELRAAYEATMPELYFGKDPLPAWEQICARVADCAELL